MMTDPNFPDRVFKTTVAVWLLFLFVFWGKYGAGAASGWSAGAAFSLGFFLVLRGFVVRTFVPGNVNAKLWFNTFMLLQVPAALVLLGLMVYISKCISGFILPFCAGVGLVQVVILLKVAGILMLEKMEK